MYIALLRGINVGGRTIKMSDLKIVFESLGFQEVKTFIASGNVLFNTNETNTEKLTAMIEETLKETFGFAIAIMLRTPKQMEKIVADAPFKEEQLDVKKYVTFLKTELTDSTISELQSNLDNGERIYLHGTEIYFSIPAESIFSNNWLEKAVKKSCTTRNWNTTRKLAELAQNT